MVAGRNMYKTSETAECTDEAKKTLIPNDMAHETDCNMSDTRAKRPKDESKRQVHAR